MSPTPLLCDGYQALSSSMMKIQLNGLHSVSRRTSMLLVSYGGSHLIPTIKSGDTITFVRAVLTGKTQSYDFHGRGKLRIEPTIRILKAYS